VFLNALEELAFAQERPPLLRGLFLSGCMTYLADPG
jgi:hypothetical protein